MIKFKNTMHAPCLYHGDFNDEFFLFLRTVDDFSIVCQLEDTYTKLCDLLDKNWKVSMSRYGIAIFQSRCLHFKPPLQTFPLC
jgi:hypothetical protein